jgi:hypothetical protein
LDSVINNKENRCLETAVLSLVYQMTIRQR